METQKKVSTWGSSRYGGGQATLLTVSIVGGAAPSMLVGWGIVSFQQADLPGWALALVPLPFWPVASASLWALLVDRSTIKDAVHNPEASIESHWYTKAAESTFYVMIAIMGLGAAAFSIFGWDLPASLVLTATTGLAMLIFLVSYQVYKRRGV